MTKLTTGQILYQITNEDDGKPCVETWIVRTIRGGKITAIWKVIGITWGKRSRKHGDFGWLPSFPAWCRKSWSVASMERVGRSGPFAHSLFTTRRAAIRDAIKTADRDDFETDIAFDNYVAKLSRMRA